MKRTIMVTIFLALIGGLLLAPASAEAQRQRPPPSSEVVAWTSDASLVIFAEPHDEGGRRTVDLVARRVPGGEVVERRRLFPGSCARVIERRLAISHGCALSELRPELPRQYRRAQFYIAANERGRISQITLRADGSVVEHELPQIDMVIRGRTEEDRNRSVTVLEIARLGGDSERGQVLERRPVRPRARRRWTLLQAGDDQYIIIGRGLLRRIGPRPSEGRLPQQGTASSHPING
jgi:hypothetical protein